MSQKIIDEDLRAAAAAIRYAQDVRATHRKRTVKGSRQREADLREARKRIHEAMVPIRSHLGRQQYLKSSSTRTQIGVRLDKASAALQAERRRLWKMMDTPKKREARARARARKAQETNP